MRITFYFIALSILFFNPLTADHLEQYRCPQSLWPLLKRINAVPEGKQLLQTVAKNGKVQIAFTQGNETYEGMWHGANRTIFINKEARADSIKLLQTIIFELQNAANEHEIKPIWRYVANRKVSKEAFVRNVEKWEHQNALRCRDLLDSGIQKGFFAPECAIYVFEDFDTHYMLQQISGHSQRYAVDYDAVNPDGRRQQYRGTLDIPYKLNNKEFACLNCYLQWRNDHLTNPRYKAAIRQLLAREVSWLRGKGDAQSQQRLAWLEQIFNGIS